MKTGSFAELVREALADPCVTEEQVENLRRCFNKSRRGNVFSVDQEVSVPWKNFTSWARANDFLIQTGVTQV